MEHFFGDGTFWALAFFCAGHIRLTNDGFEPAGRGQVFFHTIYAHIEPTILRITDFLLTKRLMTETRLGRKVLYLIAWASYLFPYGLVVSTEAAMRLVDFIAATEGPKGARFAVGPCVCQRSLKRHQEPYCKDIVLLYGADIYQYMLIGYKAIAAEEVKEILAACRDKGLVHSIDFCMQSGRWTFVICNCDKDICVLVRTYLFTGKFIYAGPEIVARDRVRCLGREVCGACVEACIFGANSLAGDEVKVDYRRCMGCGQCVRVCRGSARVLKPRPDYAHDDIIAARILLGSHRRS
ncbi:MAG TPA: 4Fe-4S binding protein [Deltaproteobacteria bacterium]|nr:4Fe-4S binding protein [Deltaproteobacteria bacterium]